MRFICPVCGGKTPFYEPAKRWIDTIWPQPKCLDCEERKNKVTSPDVIDVSGHEETTIGDIAARYLVGRTIVLSENEYLIMDANPREGSRMALRIILDDGSIRNLYLPTKIELVPIQEGVRAQYEPSN